MSDNPYQSPKCYDNTRDIVTELERLVDNAIHTLIDFAWNAFSVLGLLFGVAGFIDSLLRLLF